MWPPGFSLALQPWAGISERLRRYFVRRLRIVHVTSLEITICDLQFLNSVGLSTNHIQINPYRVQRDCCYAFPGFSLALQPLVEIGERLRRYYPHSSTDHRTCIITGIWNSKTLSPRRDFLPSKKKSRDRQNR